MGILAKIFGKPKSSDQVLFIRLMVGDEIKRGNETFVCDSITDEVLLGLPEATVMTVINSYYDFKRKNPLLSEKDVFKLIMRERSFSYEKINKTIKRKLNLTKLIKISLEHLDQNGFISDNMILYYIEKFNFITRHEKPM